VRVTTVTGNLLPEQAAGVAVSAVVGVLTVVLYCVPNAEPAGRHEAP
jgi:hypothetical protein